MHTLTHTPTPPRLRCRVRIEGKSKNSLTLFASVLQSPALSHPSMPITVEELECLLAVLIYKSLIRGFISHSPLYLVTAKEKAFPFPWSFS